jgi:hypothetical protein
MTARSTTRLFALTILALGLPTALWADGTGAQRAPHVSTAPPPQADSSDVSCSDAGMPAGTVSSVSGAAFAQAPGEDPRSLACDDVVRACDRVFTGDGGEVALLLDDVYVQVGNTSSLTVQAPAPDLFVHGGLVRVIDTRSDHDAAQFQLATPHLRSRGLRSDAEVNVGIVGADARTQLCSFTDPVTVATQTGAQTLGSGGCLEVIGSTLNALADGTPQLGVAGALDCRREFAGLASRFLPTDVAAPPIASLVPVGPPGPFPRLGCDDPGSGCTRPPSSTPSVFRDPNPTGGCGFPGAPCQIP